MSILLKVKGRAPVTMQVDEQSPVKMAVREAVPVGGFSVEIDNETLILEDGVLRVNTADEVEQDNTLPITSAAVHTTVGNIELLLSRI